MKYLNINPCHAGCFSSQFLSFFLNILIISMFLQADRKTVNIKISWILRSQLILFYTVSKQDISRVKPGVKHGKWFNN